MKALKASPRRRSPKQDREHNVLLGLVEQFLKSNKPVGSNTLKEAGFQDLSSATIRNYFAHLEEEGYLVQQHTSGGRIPTDRAFRLYAEEYEDEEENLLDEDLRSVLEDLKQYETREIASFLQKAGESLSRMANMAVFLSAPRFDHDFVLDMKLIEIDHSRCLGVLITDFGLVQTEILYTDAKLTAFSLKRIEAYFHWRLTGHDKPMNLTKDEEGLAQKFYNELMVRYIVNYSSFTQEEIYRTGFSKLLTYPEFQEVGSLANSLALFENVHGTRLILRECQKMQKLKFWIGSDLAPYLSGTCDCAVLAIPYFVNLSAVGAVGILGPLRLPYRKLFSLLRLFSESLSQTLSRSIYKNKISFRQPQQGVAQLPGDKHLQIGQVKRILLEDKTSG